jgi:PhnB protein
MVNAVPKDHTTITPYLTIDGAAKAIELYQKAFSAKLEGRMDCPKTGKVMHAVLTIGNAKLFVSDTFPEMGCGEASKSSFYLYVEDADKTFKQATSAGLTSKSEPQDMFWGDRTGTVTDAFGNNWTVATHVRDVSKDEMEKAVKEWGNKKAA